MSGPGPARAATAAVAIGAAALVVTGCGRDRSDRRPAAPSGRGDAGAMAALDRASPAAAPAAVAAAPAATSGPASPRCALDEVPARLPAPARLVAIGDVHGDLAATRRALRAAGAIDDHDRWVGGALVLVQTGDVLDRGDDEQAILDLFERLEREAAAAGGRFLWLLGNHELMNGAADFRYVTPGGFADFADVPGLPPAPAEVPTVAAARFVALAPGGPYARVMAGQNTVLVVGDTVFSHAGPAGRWAQPAVVDEVNRDNRCWLAAPAPGSPPPAALVAQDGPVWTRIYGGDPVDCEVVARALADLGAARLVVGHTPQPRGVSSACDGRLWRIDTGMARAYGGPTEVLELAAGAAPRVIKAN
ncbi:MAG: metallophosphoesterase [Kofleriaceae bacterium]|nr:metallophosphoesterase [Kofleriaceae bacterium]MBP9206607.1 metallophosphoesterase [Kofleriaceae bacterium]